MPSPSTRSGPPSSMPAAPPSSALHLHRPRSPPFEVHQLLLDPRPPKTLYAATAGGLFRLRLAP